MTDQSKVLGVYSRVTGVCSVGVIQKQMDAEAPTTLLLLQSNPHVEGKVP